MIRNTSINTQRYRNIVNNAQGHLFEGMIVAACKLYADQGRAVIDKTPEPFRVMQNGKSKDGTFKGRFTSPAQPDFQGTLAGGKSIVFEAKFTTTDRLKQDVLTEVQRATLDRHHTLGAIAAVCAGIGPDSFFIPWPIWRDMKTVYGRKYIRAADAELYRVKYSMAVLFLDYVHHEKEEKMKGMIKNV